MVALKLWENGRMLFLHHYPQPSTMNYLLGDYFNFTECNFCSWSSVATSFSDLDAQYKYKEVNPPGKGLT